MKFKMQTNNDNNSHECGRTFRTVSLSLLSLAIIEAKEKGVPFLNRNLERIFKLLTRDENNSHKCARGFA